MNTPHDVLLKDSREWKVLLLLCQPPQRPGRTEHLNSLLNRPQLHWGDLLEQALRHKLLPTLAAYVTTCPTCIHVPPTVAAHLRQVWRVHQHRTGLYRAAARNITEHLSAVGVPAVVVRGLALESALYAGARTFTDLDLRVRPDDHRRAQAVLRQLGYAPGPPGTHHRSIDDPTTSALVVDLATDLPHADPASRPAARQAAERLHHRLFDVTTRDQHDLPVPDDTDHTLILARDLASKAARADSLPLLAYADLLRLRADAPAPRLRDLADTTRGWPTAQQHLRWALTAVDRVFGTRHAADSGLPLQPDDLPPPRAGSLPAVNPAPVSGGAEDGDRRTDTPAAGTSSQPTP